MKGGQGGRWSGGEAGSREGERCGGGGLAVMFKGLHSLLQIVCLPEIKMKKLSVLSTLNLKVVPNASKI